MKQDHIIQKVFVEITVNNKEKALSIKDDINSFLSVDVFPQIEKQIRAFEHKLNGRTLQIPRLELNMEVKNSALNTELKDKIVRLFEEELSEITHPTEISSQETESDSKSYLIDSQEKMLQAFIHFLEKGSLPWWSPDKKGFSFWEPKVFETLISADNLQRRLIPVLVKPNVQDRVINQLSNEQIAQLCLAVLKDKELKINLEINIIHHIAKLSHTDRIIMWRLILNTVSKYLNGSNNLVREYLLQHISTMEQTGLLKLKNNRQHRKTVVEVFPFMKENEILEIIKANITDQPENVTTPIETVQERNTIIHQEDTGSDEGQYIQNAGLVLIHPFIKMLFEHCDLIHPETHQLTDPELCAHLLHYIATGKTNAPEHDMIFEKFLCNIPKNQSINRHIKLSRKHKTQAQNVIESVQHNWTPMKKSSAALLQNEFFQRPGKLVITDYDQTLTVERKTQDILLEKLSWGIGLVKLPWQDKFIFVNW